ncbi:GntR family transcriptional regulator [Leifsonia poae]|uniref:GntR family transcriptional regulator n=1 Tax=Leifsonia poae TaxID=110933 RepID=UPI001CBED171|nr:GntR family transcriptional regulator [Leifsonia poae]
MTDPIPAAELAYSHTKNLILTGGAPGGQLLSEAQVGDEIGVSRTPMHEAFLRLAAEGLLTLSSRKGAVVTPMSPREAQNVLDLREAIEAGAARRIQEAGGADADLVAALEAALSTQRAAVGSGDVEGFVEADQAFHAAIVDASGNELAGQFFRTLRDRQQRLRHQLFRVRPDTLADSLADHETLLATLQRDSGYDTLLHAHIARHQGAL